jgi:hypothetical protein
MTFGEVLASESGVCEVKVEFGRRDLTYPRACPMGGEALPAVLAA